MGLRTLGSQREGFGFCVPDAPLRRRGAKGGEGLFPPGGGSGGSYYVLVFMQYETVTWK